VLDLQAVPVHPTQIHGQARGPEEDEEDEGHEREDGTPLIGDDAVP
jgi:hypothetical protein